MFSVPAGLVAAALDARQGAGIFHANRPSRYHQSRVRAEGGRWTIRDGVLVASSFERGGPKLRTAIRADLSSPRVRSITIGLNPRLHDLPLMEDQEHGVVTLHVGGDPRSAGSNRGSGRSWLMLRGGDVRVEGRLIVRSGRIL
jgi:hypothetical protein